MYDDVEKLRSVRYCIKLEIIVLQRSRCRTQRFFFGYNPKIPFPNIQRLKNIRRNKNTGENDKYIEKEYKRSYDYVYDGAPMNAITKRGFNFII